MSEKSFDYRGWIKLEIPFSVMEKMNVIINVHSKKLMPAFKHFEMDLIQQTAVQVVEEQDCEPYYEVNYEIGAESFSDNLIKAVQRYFKHLAEDRLLPYQRGSLVLHSADFWSSELTCHVADVPLSAFYFGNIQGGTFINHWEVSFWNDTIRRLSKTKNEQIRAVDRNGLNHIKVEFEFDKTDLITVHFRQRELLEVSENGSFGKIKQEVTTFYQILVRRTSIRRIIVDPVVKDMYGSDRYRIHFELNCPVMIRRGFFTDKQLSSPKADHPVYRRRLTINRGRKENQYPSALAISDSPVFTIEFEQTVNVSEIYRLVSRLRIRTGVSIEFADVPSIDCLIWRENPYHRWTFKNDIHEPPTKFDVPIYRDFIQVAFPKRNEVCGSREVDPNRERKFAITYLIECLISRGAVVKDQILIDAKVWHRFLEVIWHYYKKDDKLCEAGLEDLVHMIDGRKRIGSLIKCFDRICQTREKNSLINGLTQDEMREGYQRVRKIIFTPTRVIYVAPETLMGNRVLRRYDHDGTRVLRITFRDDDNAKMRSNKTSITILEKTVDKYLREGIVVAGRSFGYLGSSNSQMRDNGAYFMEKYASSHYRKYVKENKAEPPVSFNPKIQNARKNLGRFEKIDNIPKMMARLGQCFTQSRLSGVNLGRSTYVTMYDLTGGKNAQGAEYTFSDGVGMMSKLFAENVSHVMEFGKGVPSCFQFRFRGMKGVIAIEPLLDDYRKWAQANKVPELGEDMSWELNCVFRPSQIKFISKRHGGDQVEIVKYSSPVPVALNKPFINILDQVSEMQSLECHRRVSNRIEELLDRQMLLFAQQMIDETQCRNRLKELPRRIDVDFLKPTWGFTLSNEPFFRSLIKATIKFSITRQLRKEQIPIPHELGRSMLGVVDETGRLQSGQIFVQYTKNLAIKLPSPTAARAVLTGKVLLTKNPCIVAGDVRVFEAVDIPELHHMSDVVVFPQHGPRPHPDEMAGSDLDGDEYSVIWDQEMFLDRNEKPFDFISEKQKVPFDESEIDQLMREFYVKYLKLDSVGTISNNHLHCSDQYGLNAKVCMDLAKKNCQAVDFTKSGQEPKPLRTQWEVDEETGEVLPPERAERVPDYHMGNDHSPVYVSSRLCGKLFREFKAIDDVLKISEERDEQIEIAIDENIYIAGYEKYLSEAKDDLARYNAQLRSIMENYGIRTEGEIFSGCIVDMRNRISDKDQDDMSFYNTNQMIETKVTNLFKKYRESFFEPFDGCLKNTEAMPRCSDESNILQRHCRNPTIPMMKKAVARYRACYEEARRTRENKKLSFAWTVYDIIGIVKQDVVLNSDTIQFEGANPLYSMIEKHRAQFLKDNEVNFENFKRFDFSKNDDRLLLKTAEKILKSYVQKNPGLEKILFIVHCWASAANVFDNGPFQKHHFFLLLILFGTGQFASVDGNATIFFDKIEEEDNEELSEVKAEKMTEKELSRLMIKFLEFLASRKFRKLPYLSFQSIRFSSVFMRGEWQPFHVAALKTYYNILFNLRFEELPISTDPTITVRTIIRENEPFVIELPAQCDRGLILEKLKEATGVEEIQMRPMEKSKPNQEGSPNVRLLVSTRGTLEAVYKLRQLVAVKVPLKTYVAKKEISIQLAQLCYEKIMNGVVQS